MTARVVPSVIAAFLLVACPTVRAGVAVAGPDGGACRDTLTFRRIASFTRVTALAAAPRGGLLVADASEGRVFRVDTSGVRTGIAAHGDRLAPSGLDPTNGLVLLVADPASGAVLRFAADGRFLESRPVGPGGTGTGTRFDRSGVSIRSSDSGRPVAVVETEDGGMLVADAASGTVLRYDRRHRLLRQVPAPDAPGDRLAPLALARDGGGVWVLDAAMPRILVLDAVLGETRSIRFAPGVEPVSMVAGEDTVWVLARDRVLRFGLDGALEAEFAWPGPDRPVAIAASAGRLYIATRDGLFVGPSPGGGR